MGKPAIFLRLGGCNLACSWCDTPYTWDWTGKNGVKYDPRKELVTRTVDQVGTELRAYSHRAPLLVVTGGEPMLQQAALAELFVQVRAQFSQIEIETNGTIAPSADMRPVRFNISPKLRNSGNPIGELPSWILQKAADTDIVLKFVCETPKDLEEVQQLVPPQLNKFVWIMPQGTTPDEINQRTQDLVEGVIARGWNLTTRLHVQLWGGKRGH